MEKPAGSRRRRDRRKRGRGPSNRENRTFTKCPLCDQTVRDVLTAIDYNDMPAHFDCIIKHLEETEEMEPKDKIVYLGGGSFGIVQFRNNNRNKLFVRKRIQFEEKDRKVEWRQKESEHIKK